MLTESAEKCVDGQHFDCLSQHKAARAVTTSWPSPAVLSTTGVNSPSNQVSNQVSIRVWVWVLAEVGGSAEIATPPDNRL